MPMRSPDSSSEIVENPTLSPQNTSLRDYIRGRLSESGDNQDDTPLFKIITRKVKNLNKDRIRDKCNMIAHEIVFKMHSTLENIDSHDFDDPEEKNFIAREISNILQEYSEKSLVISYCEFAVHYGVEKLEKHNITIDLDKIYPKLGLLQQVVKVFLQQSVLVRDILTTPSIMVLDKERPLEVRIRKEGIHTCCLLGHASLHHTRIDFTSCIDGDQINIKVGFTLPTPENWEDRDTKSIGTTTRTIAEIEEFLSTFKWGAYSLAFNNCRTVADLICIFLIPSLASPPNKVSPLSKHFGSIIGIKSLSVLQSMISKHSTNWPGGKEKSNPLRKPCTITK